MSAVVWTRPSLIRRRINPVYWRLMREGFDAETIKRMEFVKYLYERGDYVS